MSLGTSNRDGGKTSESGHLRALAKMVSGDVLEGLNVSQRGAGANMSVDVAVGDALIRRSDGSYAHPVFNDAVYNQAIAAADGSNPRRDIIVIYVDYGQAPSTAVSNNTNGVVKIKVVNGTPAGSPVDPNAAAIQSSVGAGNPYSILARVRVPAGQTSITNSLIDDLRSLIKNRANTVNTAALEASSVSPDKIDNTNKPFILGNLSSLSPLTPTASSRATWTVPAGASGKYLIMCTFQWNQGGENVAKDYYGALRINGVEVTQVVWTAINGSYLNTNTINYIADLVSGNTIDFTARRASPNGGSVSSASRYVIIRLS